MCSGCREWLILAGLLVLAGCEREERRFSEPGGDEVTLTTPLGDLQAGGPGVPPPGATPAAEKSPYDDNAFALAEGQRLYEWFNCSGCHAQGGGAIGPPLMDDVWVYGGNPEQIYATIVQGRPNGMPSFGARIPRQQVWQLVAYVRSLSGQLSKAASSTRRDAMHVRPGPARIEPAPAPAPQGAPGSTPAP
jgi:cytochrome c oxidase cbb3-type subunit III